jgi:transcriptional regulator with GAF, ATPase, and Fis domain
LDEIGDLPLPVQVRLLRVLQDGYLERVGGAQPIRVDVRIVAATHRDLPRMIQAGSFREDLWYRLAVFTILLPRLRERLEDIPALAQHFAERAAHRFGLAFVAPTPDNLGLLRQYPWPGNIRELASVIDRAAILGDGRTLEVAAALGGGGTLGSSAADMTSPQFDAVRSERGTAAELVTLDEAMRRHIAQALEATRGRIEGPYGAAAVLGINPHTLRARMRKLGVEWSKFRSLAWKDG